MIKKIEKLGDYDLEECDDKIDIHLIISKFNEIIDLLNEISEKI